MALDKNNIDPQTGETITPELAQLDVASEETNAVVESNQEHDISQPQANTMDLSVNGKKPNAFGSAPKSGNLPEQGKRVAMDFGALFLQIMKVVGQVMMAAVGAMAYAAKGTFGKEELTKQGFNQAMDIFIPKGIDMAGLKKAGGQAFDSSADLTGNVAGALGGLVKDFVGQMFDGSETKASPENGGSLSGKGNGLLGEKGGADPAAEPSMMDQFNLSNLTKGAGFAALAKQFLGEDTMLGKAVGMGQGLVDMLPDGMKDKFSTMWDGFDGKKAMAGGALGMMIAKMTGMDAKQAAAAGTLIGGYSNQLLDMVNTYAPGMIDKFAQTDMGKQVSAMTGLGAEPDAPAPKGGGRASLKRDAADVSSKPDPALSDKADPTRDVTKMHGIGLMPSHKSSLVPH